MCKCVVCEAKRNHTSYTSAEFRAITAKQRRNHCEFCFMLKKEHPKPDEPGPAWWAVTHKQPHAFTPGKPAPIIIVHWMRVPNGYPVCMEHPDADARYNGHTKIAYITCKPCLKLYRLWRKKRSKALWHLTLHSRLYRWANPVHGKIQESKLDFGQVMCADDITRNNMLLNITNLPSKTTCKVCLKRFERYQVAERKTAERAERARLEIAEEQRKLRERTPRRGRTPIRQKRAEQREKLGRALRPKDRRKGSATKPRRGSQRDAG